jgi:hypothetical protein
VSGSLTKTEVLDALSAVLLPYLGETMARVSARTHCDKLGVLGEEITAAEVDALLGKLASGLNVFVGRERAAAVLEEMKKAMTGLSVSS